MELHLKVTMLFKLKQINNARITLNGHILDFHIPSS